MAHPIFDRMHHIDPARPRRFDRLFFCLGAIVTVFCFFLPYSLRILLAFLINALFNRPAVYLDFFSQKVGKKFQLAFSGLVFFTIVGAYAAGWRLVRIFAGKGRGGWRDVPPDGGFESYFYQS